MTLHKNCEVCGTPFAKKRTESRRYWLTKRYCSMTCKGVAHSATMRRGQIGSTGTAFRQAARNYLPESCAVCGWDETRCDVAHIVPGIDTLENVVMLCPNHHRMFDRGLIPADEMRGLKDGIYQWGGGLIRG